MGGKVITAVVIALALVASSSAQELDRAKLDKFFDRLAEKNKAMGVLTISKDGKPVYTKAIGYGDLNGPAKIPLTSHTRFRIGSVTKMFTAPMILQLVDEKKLKLSDTLDRFLPQIPNAKRVTIEQILTHRSGIHDSLVDRSLRTKPKTEPMAREDLLALIEKGTPDFEPGTKASYSNSGYFLLGLIIEKVTGKPYGEALQEKIATKLGLKDTYVATTTIDVAKNEALTYRYLGEWRQDIETHPSNLFGGGSIISSAADLTTFIKGLFDLKLISRESLDAMKTIRDEEGMGMTTFEYAGKTFYGHTGGADNYGAVLAYRPEEKLAFAYVTNAKVYPVKDIVDGFVDIYYNRPFEIPTFEAFAVSEEVLEKYVGVYTTAGGPVRFTISRQGTKLFVQPGTESPALLEATAENKFKIEGVVGLSFEFDASKGEMVVKRPNGERVFTKDK